MEKLQIAIAATLFGWLLAQGTEYLRYCSANRKRKKAVEEELSEVLLILRDGADSAYRSYKAMISGNPSVNLGSTINLPSVDSYYGSIAYLYKEANR